MSVKNLKKLNQGILSAPGIAGYKCVNARIGQFYQNKILFLFYQWQIKNHKNGYSIICRTFPCSVFPGLIWMTDLFTEAWANFPHLPKKCYFLQKWSNVTPKSNHLTTFTHRLSSYVLDYVVSALLLQEIVISTFMKVFELLMS